MAGWINEVHNMKISLVTHENILDYWSIDNEGKLTAPYIALRNQNVYGDT